MIAGGELTVTVLLQVLLQLLVSVTVTVKVNEPPPAGFTLTEEPLVAPLMVPLPLMDQL